MRSEEEIEIINQLLVDGYDEEIVAKAIEAKRGNKYEEVKSYIDSLLDSLANRSRKTHKTTLEKSSLLEKELEEQNRLEETERKANEREKKLEQAYEAYIRNKIEEERRTREIEITELPQKNIVKSSFAPDANSCRIKIRFLESSAQIFNFKKDEPFSLLFDKLDQHYQGKKYDIYDVNFVSLERNDKTFEQMGFTPSKTLNAKKM